jgi:hypothetical protein
MTPPLFSAKAERNQDCAYLARHSLFPLQINRDGSHNTIFPALEALEKVRNATIIANPDRAPSSFFPRRVVVVRATAGVDGALTWNGQPDISDDDASMEVIPNLLYVKCMECAGLANVAKSAKAFTGTKMIYDYDGSKLQAKEVVVCTDRVLTSDYNHDKILDLPQKSLKAVEEALAHEITKVGQTISFERDASTGSDLSTAEGRAMAEVLAAKAAECYFHKEGRDVTKGSGLPLGYSILPSFFQSMLQNKCVRSVATKETSVDFPKEGSKSVSDALKKAVL